MAIEARARAPRASSAATASPSRPSAEAPRPRTWARQLLSAGKTPQLQAPSGCHCGKTPSHTTLEHSSRCQEEASASDQACTIWLSGTSINQCSPPRPADQGSGSTRRSPINDRMACPALASHHPSPWSTYQAATIGPDASLVTHPLLMPGAAGPMGLGSPPAAAPRPSPHNIPAANQLRRSAPTTRTPPQGRLRLQRQRLAAGPCNCHRRSSDWPPFKLLGELLDGPESQGGAYSKQPGADSGAIPVDELSSTSPSDAGPTPASSPPSGATRPSTSTCNECSAGSNRQQAGRLSERPKAADALPPSGAGLAPRPVFLGQGWLYPPAGPGMRCPQRTGTNTSTVSCARLPNLCAAPKPPGKASFFHGTDPARWRPVPGAMESRLDQAGAKDSGALYDRRPRTPSLPSKPSGAHLAEPPSAP